MEEMHTTVNSPKTKETLVEQYTEEMHTTAHSPKTMIHPKAEQYTKEMQLIVHS